MPGTHTPTQTWHATGTYVLTGEVITESVAKEVGTFAMDNVARLVGTAAGATPQGIRRGATVADLAALKAIAAADRADQDYVAIDTANGERLYKFDSAGAGTGDDFAIITPDAGTGRWHLVGAKPKSTTHRWLAGVGKITVDLVAPNAVQDIPNGRFVCNGGNGTLYAEFDDFNAGDVVSSVELAGNANVGGGGANIVAAFYRMSAVLAATTPTMTALGTVTIAAGAGNTNSTVSAAPLPITLAIGEKVVVLLTCNTAAPITDYIYWVALNGTRSFITE